MCVYLSERVTGEKKRLERYEIEVVIKRGEGGGINESD